MARRRIDGSWRAFWNVSIVDGLRFGGRSVEHQMLGRGERAGR